jgi:hypothetical protein
MAVARAKSVGSDDIKRDRAALETAFPRFVIIHLEDSLYVQFSDRKGGWLAALRESGRGSGRPRGGEQERATLPRLRKASEKGVIKRRHHPVCSSAFTMRPVMEQGVKEASRSWVSLGNNTHSEKAVRCGGATSYGRPESSR